MVLTLLFTLSAIVIVSALTIVSANPLATASHGFPVFPLAITAAAILALVIVGVVTESKHRLITVLETKTQAAPLVHPLWFCRHCGNQIQYSAQYCDGCGASNLDK